MRAAIARDGQLRVDDIADPAPGPGEALVRVAACGICGSDLHALRYADQLVETAAEAGSPLTFDPSRDYVMGHEFTAEVLELGAGTDGAAIAARRPRHARSRSRSRRPASKRSARTRTSTTAATRS